MRRRVILTSFCPTLLTIAMLLVTVMAGCDELQPEQPAVPVTIVSVNAPIERTHWYVLRHDHTVVEDAEGVRFYVVGILGEPGDQCVLPAAKRDAGKRLYP